MSASLCLFDLDHTLLPIDSDHAWGEFMIAIGWVGAEEFRRGNQEAYEQYQVGRLDIDAWIDFASRPFRVRSESERRDAQQRFMREVIAPVTTPAAVDLVRAHQQRGDRVALVTATNDFVTAPIAEAFGIDTLIAVAAGARRRRGTITGRIDGTFQSYRDGKVDAGPGQWLAAGASAGSGPTSSRISVYSDSVNDLPLLERATDPVATNPSPALRQRSRVARGWRILQLFE